MMNKYWLSGLLYLLVAPLAFAQECTHYSPNVGVHSLSGIIAKHQGIYGVDVSHYQGLINWKKAKQAGVSFAYVKASDGNRFTDPCFSHNWLQAQKAGVVRGAYHFFRASKNPIEQAQNFIQQVKPVLASFDLPPALDIEYVPDMNGIDPISLMAQIKQWLEYVEHELHVTPVIYTSQSFWENYIGHNPIFAKYPLWLSSVLRQPGPPSSWQEWTFWQFSTRGYVPGITTEVDLSFFGGSKKEFLKLITTKNHPHVQKIN